MDSVNLTLTCSICKKDENLVWFPNLNNELLHQKQCFTCNFWHKWIEKAKKNLDTMFVSNGIAYTIGDETAKGFRGYGGAAWIVKFNITKQARKTTNLWCQGDVPKEWISKIPVFAELTSATNIKTYFS